MKTLPTPEEMLQTIAQAYMLPEQWQSFLADDGFCANPDLLDKLPSLSPESKKHLKFEYLATQRQHYYDKLKYNFPALYWAAKRIIELDKELEYLTKKEQPRCS